MQTAGISASARIELARQVWLNYYNDYLRERHVISEEEWRKMRWAIGQSKRGETRKDA